MKPIIVLFILWLTCSWNGYSQRSIRFTCDTLNGTTVFLSKSEKWLRPTSDLLLTFEREGQKQMVKDFQTLLQRVFPDVSEEDYTYLKKVIWYVYVFPDGTCKHDYFMMPLTTVEHFPDIESSLSVLVNEIERIDFKKYKMSYIDPATKDQCLYRGGFSFMLLKQKVE